MPNKKSQSTRSIFSNASSGFNQPRQARRDQSSFGNVRIIRRSDRIENPTAEPISPALFTPIIHLTNAPMEPQDVRINMARPPVFPQPPRLEFGLPENKSKRRDNVFQLSDGTWSRPLLEKSVIWHLYESAPRDNKFAYMQAELQRHGLHTIPDYANGRILIDGRTTDRDSGYMQFIGSIIHVTDSEISILSTMQPVTMITSRRVPNIVKNWKHFDILQAEDGATLGLYWFNNSWVIRTINAFDASSIVWNDRATFGQMVDDVMRKYPQFRYDALDKTKSYTFGIKHPAIHAYHECQGVPVMRAWFIQCTDIEKVNRQCGVFNGTVSFDESIGLEYQLPASHRTIAAMSDISMYKDLKYNINLDESAHIKSTSGLSLADILDSTRGALSSVVTGSSMSAARYYGMILRSKKIAYFIPSDLYEYIASTCYTKEISELLGEEKFNRYKFIILFNALCPNHERDVFCQIYPAWAPVIGRIREFLKTFAQTMFDVYDHLTNGAKLPNVPENILNLARSMVINWTRKYGAPAKIERTLVTNLYKDYVMQKQHARVLYELVYSSIDVEINDHVAS